MVFWVYDLYIQYCVYMCYVLINNFIFLVKPHSNKRVFLSCLQPHFQFQLKRLSTLTLYWNITSGTQNINFRHILWGKICQQVCFFLKWELCVKVASSWVLSASAGRMWSALGGFVDGLTGAGVGVLWSWWSLFQTAWGTENVCREPAQMRGGIRGVPGPEHPSCVEFSQSAGPLNWIK